MTKKMIKETKNTINKSNISEKFLKYITTAISVIAIIISMLSFNYTKKNYFYSRVFQPLTYYYDFTIDNGQFTQFDQYYLPTITCRIKVNSGYINKITIIGTDKNAIVSFDDYNPKFNDFGLKNEMIVDFDLKFPSIVKFEEYFYQYIFIYVEGTNNEWNLDCLEIKYNENQDIEDICMLDTIDLLRQNTENDEITDMILYDYEMLFNEIKNL